MCSDARDDLFVTPANLTEPSRFLLFRHGVTDHLSERITGRMPGVHLNAAGLQMANKMANELRAAGFRQLFSSPLERCRETAEVVADGAPIICWDEFLELDFGDWTGMTFEELHRREDWNRYNGQRSAVRAPAGESAYDVQCRTVRGLRRIREEYGGGSFAISTHADVIRAIVCFVLGMSLDFLLRLQIDPASITEIELTQHGMRLLRLNWQPSGNE
jgi:broad specificity phosphatase PhoE